MAAAWWALRVSNPRPSRCKRASLRRAPWTIFAKNAGCTVEARAGWFILNQWSLSDNFTA